MYRVQYQCPRAHGDYLWRDLVSGLIFKTVQQFPDQQSAIMQANGLLWQYHGARVVDPYGQVVYQV